MIRHKVFRGQSFNKGQLTSPTLPTCAGRLTITLSGPAGCGKSLVAKILKALLPLTAVDEVVLIEDRDSIGG